MPSELDVQISRLAADVFRSATALVFLVSSALLELLANATSTTDRNAALIRIGPKALFVLTFIETEKDFGLFRINENGVYRLNSLEAIEKIRAVDLAALIQRSGSTCYLRATNTFHFVTPAGWHTGTFIRVADAVRSTDCLDRFAFWLLPVLARADAVFVDTWSMITVVLRASQILGKNLPFDSLSIYPEFDKPATLQLVRRFQLEIPDLRKLVFLISITSSGGLIGSLAEILETSRLDTPLESEFCSIYCFNDTPQEFKAMCKLPDAVKNYSTDECPFCQMGSTPVQVDPRLYYVNSAHEQNVFLRAPYFKESRRFIDIYGSSAGVLNVHRDDPNDQRHHAFDVDMKTLLHHREFQEKFKTALLSLDPAPKVVVTPNHVPGRELARIASELFSIPLVVHNDLRPENGLSIADCKKIDRAKHILIVDDVLNSGTRLATYNRSVRENFGNLASICFLVGLARPNSEKEWDNHKISLTRNCPWRAHLIAIETLYLPSWDSKLCPWCDEYDILSGISEKLPIPPEWLRKRLALLANRDHGISSEPIFVLQGVTARNLGAGSVVGSEGSSPIATVFSVASALHALRNERDEMQRLHPHFPDFRVFGIRNLDNYSEGLLRAILLRLVQPQEWGNLQKDTLAKRLSQYCDSGDQDILLGEIFLGHKRGSLRLSRSAFSRLFDPIFGDLVGKV